MEPVVELDRVVPDGLAFDVEGGLWISYWQPNRVYRLDPDAELETVLDDWTCDTC
jgi:gluconolactonase